MKCGAAAVQGSEASWKEEEGIKVGNIPPHTPPVLSPLLLPSTQYPHSPSVLGALPGLLGGGLLPAGLRFSLPLPIDLKHVPQVRV